MAERLWTLTAVGLAVTPERMPIVTVRGQEIAELQAAGAANAAADELQQTTVYGNTATGATNAATGATNMASIVTNAATDKDERERATTAEADLQTTIDDESTRATTSEADLQTMVDDESARATTADANLRTTIDDESARATAAEAGLQITIDSEASRAQDVEAGLHLALERADSTTVETSDEHESVHETIHGSVASNGDAIDDNAVAIGDETSRATAAEAGLQQGVTDNAAAVVTETTRATMAETDLHTAIDDVTTHALAAEAGPGDGRPWRRRVRVGCSDCLLASHRSHGGLRNNDLTYLVCICTNPGVQEMIECIDDPLLAVDRDQIVMVQTQCAPITAGGR